MNGLRIVGWVIAFAAVTALGLGAGWFARSQTLAAGTGPAAKAAGATEAAGPTEAFSARALENMGVACAPAAKGDYTVCREVLALVEELPASLRPVTARWGGTVSAVLPSGAPGADADPPPAAVAGRLLEPGQTVVEILRAPMPRIERAMTGDVVQTVSETVHDAAVQLRAARRAMEIPKLELERIRELNRNAPASLPVIPRQTEINLQYDLLKAQAEVERLEGRLFLHGFAIEHVEAAGSGSTVALTADVWRRALERNGLWPALGDRILAGLPEPLRAHPWTFAALGELSALGKCDEALAAAVAGEPGLGRRFHEAVALLQQGHSLEDVLEMVRSGALDPVIRVRAPKGAPVWEVREVRVKPGEKVEAGSVLAMLADNRRMSLELDAPGMDAALVETALREGTAMEARPLSLGAGPVLRGVRLTAYVSCPAEGGKEPHAYAVVDNERLVPSGSNEALRNAAWRLRPGMRYRVLLPARVYRGVFAFPRAAVVTEGPEKVVFLRSGGSFRRQPVRLLHEDRESVVLAEDGAVFAGDPVVVSGAFALSLALRAETKGGAVHASDKHGPTCQH